MPDPLDDLPEGTGMLTGTHPAYDIVAARRRIADKLAARRTPKTPAPRCACKADIPLPLPDAARRGPAASATATDKHGLSFHDHAARDLHTLATMVINEAEASDWLADLVPPRKWIDARGALVFACLLHLSGEPEEARWWWGFAAGAENPTATFCLYLHHAHRGELREAEHWFLQATRQETGTRGAPAPCAPPIPNYFLHTELFLQYVRTTPTKLRRPDHALREAIDARPTERLPDGLVSFPTGVIADQLHDLCSS
ncbi:hypothetical protein AB0442_29615 [Kitasatospora sp. NPDC085895]|uniref:hypothetical protein n=1 Tax=Kitasatospora sp. NPDC085895 TaxID=3155057 RepID=UPI003450803A